MQLTFAQHFEPTTHVGDFLDVPLSREISDEQARKIMESLGLAVRQVGMSLGELERGIADFAAAMRQSAVDLEPVRIPSAVALIALER